MTDGTVPLYREAFTTLMVALRKQSQLRSLDLSKNMVMHAYVMDGVYFDIQEPSPCSPFDAGFMRKNDCALNLMVYRLKENATSSFFK